MTTSKIAKTKEAAVSTTCATRKRSFLKAYRKTGFIVKAAEAIGIHRNTVERWRERDPNFVAEFESAKKDYIETLEDETDRRAMGWE